MWETFGVKIFYPLVRDINYFDDFNTKLQLIDDKKTGNKLKGDF